MTIDEEIEYFLVCERILTHFKLSIKDFNDKTIHYFHKDEVQLGSVKFDIAIHNGVVDIVVHGNKRVAIGSLNSKHINLYTKEDWYKSNTGDTVDSISFLNLNDPKLWEHENYIDSFFEDGKLCTEEEHFQLSLLHPELPGYDEIIKIRDVIMSKNPDNENWDINVRMSHASLQEVKELEMELKRRSE